MCGNDGKCHCRRYFDGQHCDKCVADDRRNFPSCETQDWVDDVKEFAVKEMFNPIKHHAPNIYHQAKNPIEKIYHQAKNPVKDILNKFSWG